MSETLDDMDVEVDGDPPSPVLHSAIPSFFADVPPSSSIFADVPPTSAIPNGLDDVPPTSAREEGLPTSAIPNVFSDIHPAPAIPSFLADVPSPAQPTLPPWSPMTTRRFRCADCRRRFAAYEEWDAHRKKYIGRCAQFRLRRRRRREGGAPGGANKGERQDTGESNSARQREAVRAASPSGNGEGHDTRESNGARQRESVRAPSPSRVGERLTPRERRPYAFTGLTHGRPDVPGPRTPQYESRRQHGESSVPHESRREYGESSAQHASSGRPQKPPLMRASETLEAETLEGETLEGEEGVDYIEVDKDGMRVPPPPPRRRGVKPEPGSDDELRDIGDVGPPTPDMPRRHRRSREHCDHSPHRRDHSHRCDHSHHCDHSHCCDHSRDHTHPHPDPHMDSGSRAHGSACCPHVVSSDDDEVHTYRVIGGRGSTVLSREVRGNLLALMLGRYRGRRLGPGAHIAAVTNGRLSRWEDITNAVGARPADAERVRQCATGFMEDLPAVIKRGN